MKRFPRLSPPRPVRPTTHATYKRRGEWVEAYFTARVLQLDLSVALVLGDSNPVDRVVLAGRKVSRVQVKSTSALRRYGYCLTAGDSSPLRLYDPREVDFIAALVIPTDTWYIIPVSAITGPQVPLNPTWPVDRGPYEKYREAWRLLI